MTMLFFLNWGGGLIGLFLLFVSPIYLINVILHTLNSTKIILEGQNEHIVYKWKYMNYLELIWEQETLHTCFLSRPPAISEMCAYCLSQSQRCWEKGWGWIFKKSQHCPKVWDRGRTKADSLQIIIRFLRLRLFGWPCVNFDYHDVFLLHSTNFLINCLLY